MRFNRQAEVDRCGWITPFALALSLACVPCLAADFSNTPEGHDGSKRFSAHRLENARALIRPQPQQFVFSRPAQLQRLKVERRDGFIGRHLAPRLERQMNQLTPIHALESHRDMYEGSALHDGFAGTAGHLAERGARRAVRDYVLEETGLGNWVHSVRVGKHGSNAAPIVTGAPRIVKTVDFGLRVSSGRPALALGHRSSAGMTRLRIRVDGRVRLDFHPAFAPAASMVAAYDPSSSRLDLAYRQNF